MRYASVYLTGAKHGSLLLLSILDILKNEKRKGIMKKTFKKMH